LRNQLPASIGAAVRKAPLADRLQRAVIVAVIPVWMMQMAGDQVADMTPMGNRFVPAARPMHVIVIRCFWQLIEVVLPRGLYRRRKPFRRVFQCVVQ